MHKAAATAARPPAPLEPVLSFGEPFLSPPLIDGSLEVVAIRALSAYCASPQTIVAPTVSRKMKMTDPSRHKIAKLGPDPLPAWLVLAASPGAARVSLCARARIRMSVRSKPDADEIEGEQAQRCVSNEVQWHTTSSCDRDPRLDRLINRLPRQSHSTIRWLRQPSSVWIRAPAAVLMTCGGLFGFLPVLGFWMLPVGVALLADDVPILRSLRSRILDWIERRHPRWLGD